MRWNTAGTAERQARNGRSRRQLRKLALIAAFLLSACGGSAPEPENVANPAGIQANRAPLSNLLRGVKFAAVAADERTLTGERGVSFGREDATELPHLHPEQLEIADRPRVERLEIVDELSTLANRANLLDEPSQIRAGDVVR